MTETGTVQVDHHQFLIAATATDTTEVTAEGNLIWTGPGFLVVTTGIAHGPATLTVSSTGAGASAGAEPEAGPGGWDVAEQAVIESAAELRVITLDGQLPPQFGPIPAGRYRVRAYARGRTTHADLDVTEPSETYLLDFTATTDPITPPMTLAGAESTSPAIALPEIDETRVWVPGPDGSHIEVDRDSPEARAVYAARGRWGGRPPAGRLATDPVLRNAASIVADLDRDLVDDIAALPPARQRGLARSCARWAVERAGLAGIADFRAALDALDHDRTPPPALANHSLAWHRLETDPAITLTVIPGFGGNPARIPQAQALNAYSFAALPDPATAAFEAVRFAAETYGQHYPELITRIRSELLDTAPADRP